MSTIKLRAKESKGVVTVKAIIKHPMETGQRKNKKTGEKIVNAKDQDKHMVQSLLDLKDKLDAILLKAFNKEESFTYALKNAFEYFINI